MHPFKVAPKEQHLRPFSSKYNLLCHDMHYFNAFIYSFIYCCILTFSHHFWLLLLTCRQIKAQKLSQALEHMPLIFFQQTHLSTTSKLLLFSFANSVWCKTTVLYLPGMLMLTRLNTRQIIKGGRKEGVIIIKFALWGDSFRSILENNLWTFPFKRVLEEFLCTH